MGGRGVFTKIYGSEGSNFSSCFLQIKSINGSHFFFTLKILHVFAAVYLKCFSAISFTVRFCHSLFLQRFCVHSCFDLLELSSEASRSGWN
jgi:hypothetical protein